MTATTTGGGVTPTSAAGSNSQNLYPNSTIRNVYAGVWFNGNTTFRDVNTRITTTACGIFNSIGDPNLVSDIGGGNLTTQTYGIQATNQDGFTISNNEIRNVSNSTGQLDGINVTVFTGTCTISNNIIRTIQRTGSTTTVMSGIRATHQTTGTNTMRMYNNAIMDLISPYTGTASTTRGVRGIYLLTTTGGTTVNYEVWNNAVVVDQTANANLSSTCFEFAGTATTGAQITLSNNVFANLTTGQTGTPRHYGINHTSSATVFGNGASTGTNNDIYISDGVGVTGFAVQGATTNYNDGAAWNTAVAQASGNISVDPQFLSATSDLHPSANALNNAGLTPPAYITFDLDCAARTPDNDIGPYILNACSTPTAGIILGNGSTCDGDVNDLTLDGSSVGLGITFQWLYGPVGGPYTTPLGNLLVQSTTGIPTGTYEVVVDVTCNAGPTTVTTIPFALTINQVPTATASNDGPICVAGTANFTGGTDIGTDFQWSGPDGFTSTNQNPSISGLTLSNGGTYTLVVTAGGCPSTPATTDLQVTNPPTIQSVTANPNPICANGSSVLNVNAFAELPNVLISEILYNLSSTTGIGVVPYTGYTDLIELNNASTVPADISGWTLADYATGTTNNSHPFTFPPGTIIPPTVLLW
ncbi:MAG: lamin tail domain-containing protein [Flavobacteriales bacterium]|nr:lamin tail domain-containing protein [Flavobacteriales bacterium]